MHPDGSNWNQKQHPEYCHQQDDTKKNGKLERGEPMIRRMQTAKKEVSVYTAEKSPHGFYWARTVSAARDLRGEKTPQEAEEELTARRTMIEFFTKQFARKDVKADPSSTSQPKPDPSPARDDDPAESKEMPSKDSSENSALPDRGLGRANFQSLAGDTGTVTRDAFKKQLSGSAAFSSRPELADRIFGRLDTDGDGSLNETEYEAMAGWLIGNRFLTLRGVGPEIEAGSGDFDAYLLPDGALRVKRPPFCGSGRAPNHKMEGPAGWLAGNTSLRGAPCRWRDCQFPANTGS